MTKGVYVLHFNSPINYDKASQYGDSQHYVGVSENIEARVFQHVSADGSEMTKAAVLQGVGFTLAAILPGDISAKSERFVQKNVKNFCRTCGMAEPVPEQKPVQEEKPKATITKLASSPSNPEPARVEWATPINLRFKNNCDRCGKYMSAHSQGAKVQGQIICLHCVRPEERGKRLAHLNNRLT